MANCFCEIRKSSTALTSHNSFQESRLAIRFLQLTLTATLLVAMGCSADSEPVVHRPPDQRFAEMVEAFAPANRQILDEWEAAVAQNDRVAMQRIQDRMIQLRASHTLTAWSVADEADDPELVLRALTWIIVNNGRNQHAKRAVRRIETKHVESPLISDAINNLMSIETLQYLGEKSPHDRVKAVAMYFAAARQPDPDRMEQMYALIDEQYAAVDYRRQPLAGLVKKPLKMLRHLRVGKPAMDIVGEDIDGNPFRLSNYRGKVVMLDFWGHW